MIPAQYTCKILIRFSAQPHHTNSIYTISIFDRIKAFISVNLFTAISKCVHTFMRKSKAHRRNAKRYILYMLETVSSHIYIYIQIYIDYKYWREKANHLMLHHRQKHGNDKLQSRNEISAAQSKSIFIGSTSSSSKKNFLI